MSLQSGILDSPGVARHFLECRLHANVTIHAVRDALRQIGLVEPDTQTVFAFGPDAVTRLDIDVDLAPFRDIESAGGQHAAATQRDVWIWIQGSAIDAVFDRVLAAHDALGRVAALELDQSGFDYRHSLDLIGFVDGTANPRNAEAIAATTVPPGVRGSGGSFVLTQQWVHDLPAFAALSIREQEEVIGRTKVEDIELAGDALPVDSHVSRTDVEVDGVAMKILRRSSPYGNATEHGLYFVAFACEQRRFQIQLERMFGVTEDGIRDRLIEYSRAVTGSYWFAPSAEALSRCLRPD